MANAEVLKPFILSWEGGFSNVKGDRGGATNKGVTIATYRSMFGQEKTIEDLKTITDIEWLHIFKTLYWDKWKADNIESQAIANLLVDWVWTSGSYGIKIPQRILEVSIDGVVGTKTLDAINNYQDKKKLFTLLWNERQEFFKRIAVKEQKKFLAGWLNRLNGIKYECLVCNNGKVINFK